MQRSVVDLTLPLTKPALLLVIMEGGFEAGERVRTGESVWTLSIATDRPPQVVITLDKVGPCRIDIQLHVLLRILPNLTLTLTLT